MGTPSVTDTNSPFKLALAGLWINCIAVSVQFPRKDEFIKLLREVDTVDDLNSEFYTEIASLNLPSNILEKIAHLTINYRIPYLLKLLEGREVQDSPNWNPILDRLALTYPLNVFASYHDAVIHQEVTYLVRLHNSKVISDTLQVVISKYPLPQYLKTLMELLK